MTLCLLCCSKHTPSTHLKGFLLFIISILLRTIGKRLYSVTIFPGVTSVLFLYYRIAVVVVDERKKKRKATGRGSSF